MEDDAAGANSPTSNGWSNSKQQGWMGPGGSTAQVYTCSPEPRPSQVHTLLLSRPVALQDSSGPPPLSQGMPGRRRERLESRQALRWTMPNAEAQTDRTNHVERGGRRRKHGTLTLQAYFGRLDRDLQGITHYGCTHAYLRIAHRA